MLGRKNTRPVSPTNRLVNRTLTTPKLETVLLTDPEWAPSAADGPGLSGLRLNFDGPRWHATPPSAHPSRPLRAVSPPEPAPPPSARIFTAFYRQQRKIYICRSKTEFYCSRVFSSSKIYFFIFSGILLENPAVSASLLQVGWLCESIEQLLRPDARLDTEVVANKTRAPEPGRGFTYPTWI